MRRHLERADRLVAETALYRASGSAGGVNGPGVFLIATLLPPPLVSLDNTGATPNDAANAAMIAYMNANKIGEVVYPTGTYLFEKTVGPWPVGAVVRGQGFGDVVLGVEQPGTIFLLSANGVAVELGHDPTIISRDGGVYENIEFIGNNPNGIAATVTTPPGISVTADGAARTWTRHDGGSFIADGFLQDDYVYATGFTPFTENAFRHRIASLTASTLTLVDECDDETANVTITSPHYGQVGLDMLNVGLVEVRNCRFGGFRYQISLDGSEVCNITNVSFDASAPNGYPSSEMIADHGVDSAFAIRIGALASQAGLASNVLVIQRCQFNNTAWGLLHTGGFNHHVRNCNFETDAGIAILTSTNFEVKYEQCEGEGPTAGGANIITTGTNYSLSIDQCAFTRLIPLVQVGGPQYGLNISGMTFSDSAVIPVAGGGHVLGGYVLGCTPAVDPHDATKTLPFFDVEPRCIVQHAANPIDQEQQFAVGCQPGYNLDVSGVGIRPVALRQRNPAENPGGNPREEYVAIVDGARIPFGGGLTDVCPYKTPEDGAFEAVSEVVAVDQANTAHVGYWRFRQRFGSSGGVSTAVGGVVSEVSDDTGITPTATPTFAGSGTGTISVALAPSNNAGENVSYTARTRYYFTGL